MYVTQTEHVKTVILKICCRVSRKMFQKRSEIISIKRRKEMFLRYRLIRSHFRETWRTIMFMKAEVSAAERNKTPILEVLKDVIKIPENSDTFPAIKILEISSGTGQHIAHFAKNLSPQILWQPTDIDHGSFNSICAYITEDKLQNVAPPVYVDVRRDHKKWSPVCTTEAESVTDIKPITNYPEESFDYIYNSNLIHIASFDCAEGLFYNSGKLLKKGGYLITYGPYGQNGVITPESNVDFNKSLKMMDPTWGVRDIQLELVPLAEQNNLKLLKIINMPANNKILIWEKL